MAYPCRRDHGLIQHPFGSEMVVYDTSCAEAHGLSEEAATVWEACDGTRSIETIAGELGLTVESVAGAVAELDRCDLLEDHGHWGPLINRRGMLVGAAVLSVPLITTSVISPALAHASTGSGTTFTLVNTLTGLGGPTFVEFSPDGKLMAVADYQGNSVEVYPVTTGSPDVVSATAVASISLTKPPSVSFNPDGTLLAMVNQGNNTITVYTVTLGATDTVSTSPVAILTGYGQPIGVTFSPNGKLLAGVDDNGSVFVYSVTLGTSGSPDGIDTIPATTISGLHFPIMAGFSPDGKLLAVPSSGGGVTVYPVTLGAGVAADTVSSTAVATVPASSPQFVAFSPDGTLLAVADQGNNTAPIYPVAPGTGTAADTVGTTAVTTLTGLNDPKSVAFSPDGTLLAVSPLGPNYGNPGGTTLPMYPVTLGQALTADAVSSTAVANLTGLNGPYSAAFSPDGSLFAVPNFTGGTVSVFLRS